MAKLARRARLVKQIQDAGDLARTGAIMINDGESAIYFLWGQPSHAYARVGDLTVEGDAALKTIAFQSNQPGKVTWSPNTVLQRETLHCTTDQLKETIDTLAGAASENPEASNAPVTTLPSGYHSWDGEERRAAALLTYDLSDFPLLPTGTPLWSGVPANVVHLDVLLGGLDTALVVITSDVARGVGIARKGAFGDGLFIDSTGLLIGEEAGAAIMKATEGEVSAFEIDDKLAQALPHLWRSRVMHRDLDKRWFDGYGLLDALQNDGEDKAVIVATSEDVGVVLLLQGQVVAAYTAQSPEPRVALHAVLALFHDANGGTVSILDRSDDVVPRQGRRGFRRQGDLAEAEPPPPEVETTEASVDAAGTVPAAAEPLMAAFEPSGGQEVPSTPSLEPVAEPAGTEEAAPVWESLIASVAAGDLSDAGDTPHEYAADEADAGQAGSDTPATSAGPDESGIPVSDDPAGPEGTAAEGLAATAAQVEPQAGASPQGTQESPSWLAAVPNEDASGPPVSSFDALFSMGSAEAAPPSAPSSAAAFPAGAGTGNEPPPAGSPAGGGEGAGWDFFSGFAASVPEAKQPDEASDTPARPPKSKPAPEPAASPAGASGSALPKFVPAVVPPAAGGVDSFDHVIGKLIDMADEEMGSQAVPLRRQLELVEHSSDALRGVVIAFRDGRIGGLGGPVIRELAQRMLVLIGDECTAL